MEIVETFIFIVPQFFKECVKQSYFLSPLINRMHQKKTISFNSLSATMKQPQNYNLFTIHCNTWMTQTNEIKLFSLQRGKKQQCETLSHCLTTMWKARSYAVFCRTISKPCSVKSSWFSKSVPLINFRSWENDTCPCTYSNVWLSSCPSEMHRKIYLLYFLQPMPPRLIIMRRSSNELHSRNKC